VSVEAAYTSGIDDLAAREAIAASIPDVVRDALSRLPIDAGALFESVVLETLKGVRQADPAAYARIRAQAKEAKVSVGQLDRLTTPDLEEGAADMFPAVEAWPDPVDTAEVLAELTEALHRHVIADSPTITAAALWAMHSWCMDVLTISPLAHITAPEKRCGKTVLLTALSKVVCRPLPASNISPAALFRSMELWQPTLLIDEADTFLRDNEEARGLINSGLYRETAFVIRTVGDDHVPTQFRTWGAKVVCGIGKLADTIEDRSIPLRLRRKVPGERVDNIRLSNQAIWKRLQSRIARWADDNAYAIEQARPAPAIGLNDRAQDCWEPLLAIADLAGKEWGHRARAAAQALHGIEEETPSISAELLADIKETFERRQASRLATTLLIEQLIQDEEAPWATWNRGRAMTARQLAGRLGDFGIRPKPMRVAGEGVVKGYDLEDFRDAFRRYLSSSPENSSTSVTRLQPHNHAGSETSRSVTPSVTDFDNRLPVTNEEDIGGAIARVVDVTGNRSEKCVTDAVTEGHASQTAPLSQCNRVTDSRPFSDKKEEGDKEVFEV
jgi:hypothetical protein